MWLEGKMGAGNTNVLCCGRGKLTCAHQAAVSGKHCSRCFICSHDISSQQMPLMQLSKRQSGRLHNLNYVKPVKTFSLYIRL